MAIYHLAAKVIKRSNGRSATAAAAYRAGCRIEDKRLGITHDYRNKAKVEGAVEHTEIMAPRHAPEWVQDRSALWNAVEQVERRGDAQVAREIVVALPRELDAAARRELVRDFAQKSFVERGMVADIAIHNPAGQGNPHAHIMLTMRSLSADGFGKKERKWNAKDFLKEVREEWAMETNRHLSVADCAERIDHRSFEEREIDRLPTIHHQNDPGLIQHNELITQINDYAAERGLSTTDALFQMRRELTLLEVEIERAEIHESIPDVTEASLSAFAANLMDDLASPAKPVTAPEKGPKGPSL